MGVIALRKYVFLLDRHVLQTFIDSPNLSLFPGIGPLLIHQHLLPTAAMNSTEAELESFRQKWREEVNAKQKGKAGPSQSNQASPSKTQASNSNAPEAPTHPTHHRRDGSLEEVDEVEPHFYHDLGEKQHGRRLDETATSHASSSQEPKSALEHYERAVEKESQGSLGDSLNLYRKAFKVLYRKLHLLKNCTNCVIA